jgi:hypothetical protein
MHPRSPRRKLNKLGLPQSLLERLESRFVFSAFTVTNLADSGPGSLREAIDAANATPGEDVIAFPGGLKGTISLASQLSVTDDLTITGNSLDKITVSGNDATRVIAVSGADTDVKIEQITIADGLASAPAGTAVGGGLLNDGAHVSLDHVTFDGNRAVGHIAAGGAVANIGGQLDGDHLEFAGNSVRCDDGQDCFGGAVFNDRSARMNVDHANFSNNLSLDGGANGGAVGIVNGSEVSLAQCDFTGNQALGAPEQYGGGGAIVVQSTGLGGASSGPVVNLSHCSFTGNRAGIRATNVAGSDARGQGFGGAIIVEFGPTPPTATPPAPQLLIEYSSFDGNTSEGRSGGTGSAGVAGRIGGPAWGGAVHNVSSTVILRHDHFTNNLVKGGDGGTGGSGASGGAGNFAIGGAVASGTLSGNNTSPSTIIEACEFLNNRAIGGTGGAGGTGGNGGVAGRADGAGVANLNGPMSIDDSWIFGNTAQGGEGGAAGTGATTKGGDGGLARGAGFANERGSLTTVSGTTIASNRALGGAGGVGRVGGDAMGGGVFNGRQAGLPPDLNAPANLTLIDSSVTDNLATAGAGGAGANGGNALGGGIVNFNPPPALPGPPLLTLLGTLVAGNSALAGAAGTGGLSGAGLGGGLYNQTGASASVDSFSVIAGNHASASSSDDIFGTATPI